MSHAANSVRDICAPFQTFTAVRAAPLSWAAGRPAGDEHPALGHLQQLAARSAGHAKRFSVSETIYKYAGHVKIVRPAWLGWPRHDAGHHADHDGFGQT